MSSEIYNIISILANEIKTKLPESFEEKYYEKMSYSGNNKTTELEKSILYNTICFEVAFVHVMVYSFNMCYNREVKDYKFLLENLDADKLFSWYQIEEKFIDENLSHLELNEFSDIYDLINQHDTFIDKSIKKELGQFYTPVSIVKSMIFEIRNNLKLLTEKDLTIDPACGTGIFLVEIIKELNKFFTPSEVIGYVENCIFGYDVNPFAIMATKINISYVLLTIFPNEYEDILRIINGDNAFGHIIWKNTLIDKDIDKYSVILGNPPYFKLNNKLIRDIKGYEEILYGQPNIYSFFMYWSMQHLKENGVMSFIVPQSIRSGLYFKKLRGQMKNLRITSLIHIDSRQNLFDRAEQAVLIICLENKPILNSKTKIQFNNGTGEVKSSFKVSRSKLMLDKESNHIFVITKNIEMYTILDKVYSNSSYLDTADTKVKFCNGLFVWNQHKKDIVEKNSYGIPIVYGGNVQPLKFNFSVCSSNEERKQYALINDNTKSYVLSGKRLLIQRTTNFERDIRLKSCLISDEFLREYNSYFLENHINFLCSVGSKNEILSTETMHYYLGLLNSKLVNYIFTSKSGNTQVSANELNSLPFPKEGFEAIATFVSEHLDDMETYQKELDILVCQAYGLSDNETEFIINY